MISELIEKDITVCILCETNACLVFVLCIPFSYDFNLLYNILLFMICCELFDVSLEVLHIFLETVIDTRSS